MVSNFDAFFCIILVNISNSLLDPLQFLYAVGLL